MVGLFVCVCVRVCACSRVKAKVAAGGIAFSLAAVITKETTELVLRACE